MDFFRKLFGASTETEKKKERVCSECGVTYYDEYEVGHIEDTGMCSNCMCIFDDELREMDEDCWDD